jgi:hypothetical protein
MTFEELILSKSSLQCGTLVEHICSIEGDCQSGIPFFVPIDTLVCNLEMDNMLCDLSMNMISSDLQNDSVQADLHVDVLSADIINTTTGDLTCPQ